MLNYNSPINESKNYSELIISEVEPTIKINLRGKKREFITKIGKSLSIIPPTEANTSSGNEILSILWLSPDEWMIVSNETTSKETNTYELNDILFSNISKTSLGAVTDVTDQFVQLEIKGDKIYELFSSGCPFNFNLFREKKGSTVQTLLNHIDVIIHNKDKDFVNLFVRRSFTKHLWEWMEDSSLRL